MKRLSLGMLMIKKSVVVLVLVLVIVTLDVLVIVPVDVMEIAHMVVLMLVLEWNIAIFDYSIAVNDCADTEISSNKFL